MAKRGASNNAKIKREEADLGSLLTAMPSNPIAWGVVIRLVAPVVARLAVRYALKKLNRSLSEDKVNAIGSAVAGFVGRIVDAKTPPKEDDK